MSQVLLEVQNLQISVKQKKTTLTLVEEVNFSLHKGECLGILGESGSGKSLVCKSIMGLLGRNFVASGTAEFQQQNLLQLKKERLRQLRGQELAMIMQNPMTCFDPLQRIGKQMAEGLLEKKTVAPADVEKKSFEILEKMSIRQPAEVLRNYPHQLSGGMLQRIMIGLALAGNAQLLVLDEPTTAIDSITQYEIMQEFQKIKQENHCGMLFVSHDLGVISKIADRVLVMHQGALVQSGTLKEIIKQPVNAYTEELIRNKLKVMTHFQQVLGG